MNNIIILLVTAVTALYLTFKGFEALYPCNYTLDAFKTILGAIRTVITVNPDHDSTTARPDHFRKRRQPEPLKAALYFCGLNSFVQNAQKPLFYRLDAVQQKPSKHMNISTHSHANYVKLDAFNSKIGKSWRNMSIQKNEGVCALAGILGYLIGLTGGENGKNFQKI